MKSEGMDAPESQGLGKQIAGDLLPSVVVFLVALPLCMGIAIASGVPPALGLITGIVGGIVVGAISGCQLGVSGPAAGLTVIIWQIVDQYGIEALAPVVFLAGLIQIGAGLLQVGQWFRAVSPAVIRGMLAGIGVLIFASQFHVMIDDVPRKSGVLNLISIPEAILKAFIPSEDGSHQQAAAIGALTMVVIVSWNYFRPRRFALIPAPLIAVAIAMVGAAIFRLDINYVEVPANLTAAFQWLSLDSVRSMPLPTLLAEALALAFIASAETLLCATAVDQMHSGQRTDYNRELTAQGVGNSMCGVVGALPMTAVIVRSAANVGAGAKTRYSGILHGVWMLALVVAFPKFLELIPTASLAAVLVYTGYKLVDIKVLRQLREFGWSEVGIYAITVITIVAADLLSGVIIGLVLSAAKLIYTLSHLGITVDQPANNVYHVHLRGAATFVAIPVLSSRLEALPEQSEVHIRFDDLRSIDHACIDYLGAYAKRKESRDGGPLIIEWDDLMGRYPDMGKLDGTGTKQKQKQKPPA